MSLQVIKATRKTPPICDVFGCRRRSAYHIGKEKFRRQFFNVCQECATKIHADLAKHLKPPEAEKEPVKEEAIVQDPEKEESVVLDPEDTIELEVKEGNLVPKYDDITLDQIKKRLDTLGIDYTARETKRPLYDRLIEAEWEKWGDQRWSTS